MPEAMYLPPPKCTSTRLAPAAAASHPPALQPRARRQNAWGKRIRSFPWESFLLFDTATPCRYRRTIAVGRVLQSPAMLMLGHRQLTGNCQTTGKCLAILANKAACHKIAPRSPHGQVGYSPWARVMRSAISVAVLVAMLAWAADACRGLPGSLPCTIRRKQEPRRPRNRRLCRGSAVPATPYDRPWEPISQDRSCGRRTPTRSCL